jgi:alpha-tubulin suppressor-like RCC1 family protein
MREHERLWGVWCGVIVAVSLGCASGANREPDTSVSDASASRTDIAALPGERLLDSRELSAGGHSVCGVRSGLVCWGANDHGQLGVEARAGTDEATVAPQQVVVPVASAVAVGRYHGCALAGDALWCWGNNQYGQLGVAGEGMKPAREVMRGVSGFALGDGSTCAIRAGGELVCWGHNSHGQLGGAANRGTRAATLEPQQVFARGVRAVSAGSLHACAIDEASALWCWGKNYRGQRGDSAGMGSEAPGVAPVRVFASGVSAVAAGGEHTCAIHGEALKCWGSNFQGQLGVSRRFEASGYSTHAPQEVFARGVSAVAAGGSTTCAVHDGAVKCWGDNTYGQHGAGARGELGGFAAMPVTALTGGITALSVGDAHVCAREGGRLLCWGDSAYGQAGVVDAEGVTQPRPLEWWRP